MAREYGAREGIERIRYMALWGWPEGPPETPSWCFNNNQRIKYMAPWGWPEGSPWGWPK